MEDAESADFGVPIGKCRAQNALPRMAGRDRVEAPLKSANPSR